MKNTYCLFHKILVLSLLVLTTRVQAQVSPTSPPPQPNIPVLVDSAERAKSLRPIIEEVAPAPAPVNPSAASRKVPVWAAKKARYNAARPRLHDLLHTRLDLRPDWQKQHLHGTATLTLRPHFYPQNTLELDAKGMTIQSVMRLDTLPAAAELRARLQVRDSLLARLQTDTTGLLRRDSVLAATLLARSRSRRDTLLTPDGIIVATDSLTFRYNAKTLTVELGKSFTRQQRYTLRIGYVAKPNDLPVGGSEAIKSDRGLYFINPLGADTTKPRQLWTQGETEANSVWFPTLDAPNVKMTQDIFLTVEARLKTLSNGTLIDSVFNPDSSRTDHWRQTQPHAPYLTMIAVGNYAIITDSTVNKVPISYYVEPAYAPYAKAIFGRTPEMMRFFNEKFGLDYPWDKYAQIVVRDYVSGAMENTTATVHGESVQKTPKQLVDGNADGTIAHELSHHWFGDYVTGESWANLPLNESFATYAEYLWAEHKHGKDAADYEAQSQLNEYLAESEQKQEPLVRFNYSDQEQMFDAHSYQKGARVLHQLRKLTGDDAFFAALNLYLKRHAFGTAEIHDLRLAVEEITGQDWNWFFNQWFFQPGHPEIRVEQNFDVGRFTVTLTQTQDTLYTPIFRLPTTLDVWVLGKRTTYDITLDKPRQVLEFPLSRRPDLVVLDAERVIPGTIEHTKPLKDWVFQYRNAEHYASRYEAITRLENNMTDSVARSIMMLALTDKFWKIRQVAAGNLTDYDGPQFVEIELMLQKLIKSDPAPMVRSEALIALSSFNDDENVPLYRQALQDTSDLVASQALEAYLITRPEDAGSIAIRFENSDNPEVVVAVGNYLANQGEAARYDWFQKQVERLNASGVYQFLPVFGKYLVKSTDVVKRRSIPVLERIARNNPTYFVRLAAYQVLGLLTDVESVKGLRRDIKANEKDPKLADLYKQMIEF
ncbi:MAG: M1 family metallopeptidase [Cytophagaceae bacterium]|nr:M1 family metallopeptidase [Cytophagaceae bacterium]